MSSSSARRGRRLAAIAITLGLIGGSAIVAATPAAAAEPLSVTYVARICDEYTDVMANKARNNIMESLRNLGADSTYAANGVIDPASEAAGSPNCRPLTDWTLSSGRGIIAKAEAANWLSRASSPYAGGNVTTTASTPMLDSAGLPTGQNIAGAVTVPLTAEQSATVQSGGRLVVQSGVGTDTLNGRQATAAFGTLRCAQDGLNGDNADYVWFPNGSTHVFCYFYAVTPPPGTGTITVRKEVPAVTNGEGTFDFEGNISFNKPEGQVGTFSLRSGATTVGSQTFIRAAVGAGEMPWTFRELPEPGWTFDSLTCVSATGASQITTSGPDASIRLAEDDDVTCTYMNSRVPTGPAALYKATLGRVGTFPFTIVGPSRTVDATVTTLEEGTPELVTAVPSAEPGTITARETMPPATPAGFWEMATAQCNGDAKPIDEVSPGVWETFATFQTGDVIECLVVNQFVATASLSVAKVTTGGVGTFTYDMFPLTATGEPDSSAGVVTAHATTTQEGLAVAGDTAYEGIDVQEQSTFGIQEIMPATSDAGVWRMTGVDCGGAELSVDLDSAYVTVAVTEDEATPVCTFSNEFVPAGTVTVTKNAPSDLGQRSAPVILVLDCDGAVTEIVLEPGASTVTETVTGIREPRTCTLTESQTGAASGWDVATRATLSTDDGPGNAWDALGAFEADLGVDTVIVVDNVYTATSAPAPPAGGGSGGGSGTGTVSGAGSGAGLAATGQSAAWASLAVGGAAALFAGLALALMRRRTA